MQVRRGRPPKAAKVTRTCDQCGSTWQAYPWDLDRLHYCSRKCWGQSRVGKQALFRVEPETKFCAHCNKPYLVGGAGRPKRRNIYCSRSCARKNAWQGKGGHAPAREMSQLECAWFAGIFDGEGCIAWPRRTVLHSVRLDMTNTCKPLMDRVATVTATGRIVTAVRQNKKHSQTWRWQAYGENARFILKQILPWLIVKKYAAEVALGIEKPLEPPWSQRTKTTMAADACE